MTPTNHIPNHQPIFTHLTSADGQDVAFDLAAYSLGYFDSLSGRPYNDRLHRHTMIIFVPPSPRCDHPLSWQESYRWGWIAGLQSRN